MINTTEIITRLQNGESSDAIAAEMAKALNDANAAFQKKSERAEKIEALDDILDHVYEFCTKYYPDAAEALYEIDGEDILDMIDEVQKQIAPLNDILRNLEALEAKEQKTQSKPVIRKITSDEALKNFMKEFGLD